MADIDAYKKQLLDVDSSVTNQYTMVKRVASASWPNSNASLMSAYLTS